MLNLQQLSQTARGLQEEMIWRKNQVGHELIENHYLRLENKKQAREDYLYYSIPDSIVEPDTLIRQFSPDEQRAIYTQALNFARAVQSKLSDSQETVLIRKRWANMYRNEWNRILVNGVACIMFLLIGAPLGAFIRKGGLGSPVLVSIMVFIVYFIMGLSGEKYARAAEIPSWLGMWSPVILLLPLAIILMIKSNKDSGFKFHPFKQNFRSSSAG